jgi:hypothetical protein
MFRRESEMVQQLSEDTKETRELAEEVCRLAVKSNRVKADSKHLRLLSPIPPLPPPPADIEEAAAAEEEK